MRIAAPLLLLALGACAATSAELDELARVRAEIDGVLDDVRGELRKLREKPPPPRPSVQLGAAPTIHAVNDLYWVLSPVTVGSERRTALSLYRATSRGVQPEGTRILEDDLAKALK